MNLMFMYFVHPQIKLNRKNFKQVFACFFKRPDLKNLENRLSLLFPNEKIIFTDMGRTAFQIIIEKMNLRNSAMLVPAYLCDIFFPIFKKYNISPIFLDVDLETFNLDIQEIEKKISPNVKSILVPHIYGLPNNITKIKSLTKKYNIKIIEDCAHAFGAKEQGIYTGNFGDAALFSLYKIFPCFRGGMLVCPKDWQINLEKTKFSSRDFISFLNCFPVWAYLFKKFGNEIAPKIIRKEKLAKPAEINRISLNLFSYFSQSWEQNSEKRIKLALIFQKELKKMGFSVQKQENNRFCYISALLPKNLENKRDIFLKKLSKNKVFCTRMWHTPLVINPVVQKEYNLDIQDFPNTKETARRIINFPLQNFYKEKDIEKIIKILQKTMNQIA
ncbi:DegT/DnrJ/EryC1/StrS family aminotransferase [Candidatus Parcubacteria bacterium]|nr:DegT/DnrJ/EryC1/StrS family aminotransferase [Candidatus Parcubacteria bacterium]